MAGRDERPPGEDALAMLASVTPPVGLPDGEEPVAWASTADGDDLADVVASDVVASDDVPGGATIEADDPPTRADRISSFLAWGLSGPEPLLQIAGATPIGHESGRLQIADGAVHLPISIPSKGRISREKGGGRWTDSR